MMIEELYDFNGFCQHRMNPAACPQCMAHPRTTLCIHGWPVATCNQCSDDLADTVEDVATELHEEQNG